MKMFKAPLEAVPKQKSRRGKYTEIYDELEKMVGGDEALEVQTGSAREANNLRMSVLSNIREDGSRRGHLHGKFRSVLSGTSMWFVPTRKR